MKKRKSVATMVTLVAVVALIGILMGVTGCMFQKDEEKVRQHLEKKYGESFVFIDYPGALSQNELRVTLSCESFPQEQITARIRYVDDKPVYQDNYMAFYWKNRVENLVLEAAEEAFGTTCKVFGRVSSMALLDDDVDRSALFEEYTSRLDSRLMAVIFTSGALNEQGLERLRGNLQSRKIVLQATVVQVEPSLWDDVSEADARFLDFTTGKFNSCVEFYMSEAYDFSSVKWSKQE